MLKINVQANTSGIYGARCIKPDFQQLVEINFPIVKIRDLAENVQYGYTEKSAIEEIGQICANY